MNKFILASLLLLSATSQVEAAPKNYTITFSAQAINWLIEKLIAAPIPFEEVQPVLQAIQQTIQEQNKKELREICDLEQLPANEKCGE